MAPLRVIALPAFAAVAAAISVSDYVPACGPPCISDTVAQHTTCAADDNACICAEVYTVKRDGEVCLRDACSTTDYGSVMSGIDAFCKAVSSGPTSSSTSTSSTASPTSYPTSTDIPSSSSSTESPTESTGSGYPTSTPSTSSSETAPGYPSSSASSSSVPGYPTGSSSSSPSGPSSYPSGPSSSGSSAPSYPSSTSATVPSGPSSGLPGSPSSTATGTPSPIPGAGSKADTRMGAGFAALMAVGGLLYLGM